MIDDDVARTRGRGALSEGGDDKQPFFVDGFATGYPRIKSLRSGRSTERILNLTIRGSLGHRAVLHDSFVSETDERMFRYGLASRFTESAVGCNASNC